MKCKTRDCKKKATTVWNRKDYCEDCFERLKHPEGRKFARGPVY